MSVRVLTQINKQVYVCVCVLESVHLLNGSEQTVMLEPKGRPGHQAENKRRRPHRVLLVSEHPQNILQVHGERGQKVPQRPQEPLRGHPAL